MIESNTNWTNITAEFKQACSVLHIGELFKEEGFSLFEAMSAIEMMDPKMDAGLLSNQSKRKVSSIEEAIEKGLIKVKDISMEEKLAIIDQTYCHLYTWLDGTSLAQTVFTNIYLHNTDLIEDKLMKWFSIGILKIVDSMRNKIMSACVFEEEDFQSMHYGFKFANDINETTLTNNLKTIEDECGKLYRNLKSQQTSETKLQVDLASALLARIKFTRALYQLMQYLNENTENNIEEIVKYCNMAKENLKVMEETFSLGVNKPQIVNDSNNPSLMGFETLFNQRLLPPTFPRHIKIHSFEFTIKELRRIIEQIQQSLEILKLNNIHQIFEFIVKLDADHKLSILNRSILQLIGLPLNSLQKIVKMKEILKTTLKQFIEPPSLHPKCFLSNQTIVKQLIDNFLTKCSQVFVSLVQIIGNNRARQREKLGFIIEDFTTLQEEGASLDHILNTMLIQQKSQNLTNSCYRTWVVYNNLIVMSHYLLYGFELDLYSNYEYHYIYWYLGEMLYSWLISNLNQVDQCISISAILNSEGGKKDKNKAKKKGKTTLEKDIQLMYGHRFMCRAYYAAMKAFGLEKKISEPNEEFNDEELRFQNRFLPFKAFSNYAQFKDKDLQFLHEFNNEPLKIFSSAQELFEKAKNIYEELNDFNSSTICAKVAKTNFIVMRLLSSGMKKINQLEFDFSAHPHYPIIRI